MNNFRKKAKNHNDRMSFDDLTHVGMFNEHFFK